MMSQTCRQRGAADCLVLWVFSRWKRGTNFAAIAMLRATSSVLSARRLWSRQLVDLPAQSFL